MARCFCAVVLLSVVSCGGGETRAKKLAYFIIYTDSPMVDDCRVGLLDELPKLGMVPGRDLVLTERNAQGDMPTLQALVDAALSQGPDVIMCLSTPTLQALINRVKDIPIVFTVVANPVHAGAGKTALDHLPNVTGVSTASDYVGMARLVRECLPDATAVGTLFATGEDNSVFNRESMENALRDVGIKLVSTGVSTTSEIPDAAQSLVGRNIQAVCQVLGNITESGFPAISQAARKSGKPVFAFTSGAVEKGMADVALARDYEQAGRDMARLAVYVLRGENPANMPFQTVSKSNVVVNLKTSAKSGLDIPPAVLNRASGIIE